MEQATWTRVDAGQAAPLDMMTARFTRHVYAPHAHDEFSIGVCTDGVEVIDVNGVRHLSGPGQIVVIEPGVAHTGGPAGPAGFAYRVLYPQWTSLAERDAPHFPVPVIDDPLLAGEIERTHATLVNWRDPLEAESRLSWVLAKLVRRHAVGAASPAVTSPSVVAATMDRLADGLLDPPSLQQIATDLGMSRFQLLRSFRETVGMPPYAWLSQYRVNRARRLLADGYRPAQAATLTGFADQAHLTRWFRRVLGVTPGAFRNSVQDFCGPVR